MARIVRLRTNIVDIMLNSSKYNGIFESSSKKYFNTIQISSVITIILIINVYSSLQSKKSEICWKQPLQTG